MAEFFFDYGLFALKLLTIIIGIVAVVVVSVTASMKSKGGPEGHIEVVRVNDEMEHLRDTLSSAVIDNDEFKIALKKRAKEEKAERKAHLKALKKNAKKNTSKGPESDAVTERKSRVFVLEFVGDIKASAVSSLRQEITAVLSLAEKSDEVVVRLESGGGMVHAYGLASSQLQRIKDREIALTICVDKVAASGLLYRSYAADDLTSVEFWYYRVLNKLTLRDIYV